MTKKKKKKIVLTKKERLQLAPSYLSTLKEGSSIIKRYALHYRIPKVEALEELKTLGYQFSEEYLENFNFDDRHLRPRRKDYFYEEPTSDAYFAFIAGYTDSGIPYGITWEEADEMNACNEEESGPKKEAIKKITTNDDDLPF